MNEETLTLTELNKILAQVLKLDQMEKMGVYHGLVQILKNADNPREAANTILTEIEQLFRIKAGQTEEKIEQKLDAPATGRISPIFRRIGG